MALPAGRVQTLREECLADVIISLMNPDRGSRAMDAPVIISNESGPRIARQPT